MAEYTIASFKIGGNTLTAIRYLARYEDGEVNHYVRYYRLNGVTEHLVSPYRGIEKEIEETIVSVDRIFAIAPEEQLTLEGTS